MNPTNRQEGLHAGFSRVLRVVLTVAITGALLGPGRDAPREPIWAVAQEAPAEELAQDFLRGVVADDALAACFNVSPNFAWINPCLNDVERRKGRLDELRASVSPLVRVRQGVVVSSTRVDFTSEHLIPRPELDLTLTVERDRNNDWRVSGLDGLPFSTG
ncbi:MAG: hypothetical protein Q4F65_06000 [Propionibacteriaceae bacterium]|nr:hypothetical protein [Propionibacteriaceae bacterium]